MPSFSSLVAASLLASVTVASPVSIGTRTTHGFSVKQTSSKTYKPAGPVALANAYGKFKASIPEVLVSAASAASSSGQGEATATPQAYDELYLTPVSVGGQTLDLDFDTGSADLWVFSSQLSSSQRSGHNYYDPSNSSTSSLEPGEVWYISYGDGSSASGDVYSDNVDVGGVTVTGQAVEAAWYVSSEFQSNPGDGLLGLAFSSINTVLPIKKTTWFQSAANQGLLSQNLFTADLKKGEPGTYDFGYIDSSKYTGDITYTAVDDSSGYWGFTSSGYAIGSGSFVSNSTSGILDTGTTLLLLDDAVVDAYYAEVTGASYDSTQEGWVFPSTSTLPDFYVGIGSSRFKVPGSYIAYAPTDTTGATIYGGIQSDSSIGFPIYGDIFLKAIFAVFDNGNLQLGFAEKDL